MAIGASQSVDQTMPDFEHVNINEINPDFEPIKEAYYTLEVAKVQEKAFTGKPTKKDGSPNPRAGQEQKVIKLHVVVVEDEEFSGRRVFPSVFEGSKKDYQFVARIAKAVTMPQEQGEKLFEFLARIAESGARFKGKINPTPDDPYNDNELDKFSVQAL